MSAHYNCSAFLTVLALLVVPAQCFAETAFRSAKPIWPTGREKDINLLIIDYLQLIQGPAEEGRQQEISAISRGLKALAKELGIPVIALSQLSRAVEIRGGDKRPMLSDLRDSGAIEQDADLVLFIYRPEFYKEEFDADGNDLRGLAEIIIAKQRNGPTGKVDLAFVARYSKFGNIDPIHEVG